MDTLRVLAKAKPAVVKKIIKPAKRDLVDALSELSLNLLRGVIPVSRQKKARLTRHKHGLRALAQKGSSIKKRKEILQKGGLVGSLLAATLPLAIQGIASAVKSAKSKRRKR